MQNKRSPKQFSQASSKTRAERTHRVEKWKFLRMDCAGGTLVSTKKLERVLSLKNGNGSPDKIKADVFECIAPGMFGKTGEIHVRDVLGHEPAGAVDVLFDGNGTKSGWVLRACPS